jgi:hypothetical protein
MNECWFIKGLISTLNGMFTTLTHCTLTHYSHAADILYSTTHRLPHTHAGTQDRALQSREQVRFHGFTASFCENVLEPSDYLLHTKHWYKCFMCAGLNKWTQSIFIQLCKYANVRFIRNICLVLYY